MAEPDQEDRPGVDISSAPEPESEAESGPARAVALKDSSQSQTMPRVVASGQGAVAEQILQIAWANDIKVREDADLVEVLSAIDVESEIPVEAFAAVAEILSYLYRANAGLVQPGSGDQNISEDETSDSEKETP